jgi:enoyl-CoA hydratase/carnithine racemase
MTELVTYTSQDHVATVTINRPDRMNALNEEVILALQAAWQRLERGDDRVAVLTAAGDRAFSVGADVKDTPKEMWQGVPEHWSNHHQAGDRSGKGLVHWRLLRHRANVRLSGGCRKYEV